MSRQETLVIVGSGPAAWTAAIYAARANLNPIVFEGEPSREMIPGGQLMWTTDIENFPGFPNGVGGQDLMDQIKAQAVRFGARAEMENIAEVDFSRHPLRLHATYSGWIEAQAVILATGARANWLGVPGETELARKGAGVSACCVCDAALMARDRVTAVVGGGDSACEEALYATKFASKVYLIHRRDELRASKVMAERVLAHPKIEPVWNQRVVEMHGTDELTGATLENTITGERTHLPLGALFVAIGHTPNTAFLKGQVSLTKGGLIAVDPGTTWTNRNGVFAAGDVMDANGYRQAITAAGTGCMAALDAERFLAHRG